MTDRSGIILKERTYDRAKFLVQIVLPALGVFYASMAAFWGWPDVDKVVGSLAAFGLLIGAIMRVSSKNYTPHDPNKKLEKVGSIIVHQRLDGGKRAELEFDKDPANFIGQSQIVFDVVEGDPDVEENLEGE